MQQSLSIMGDASGTDIIPETELKARDEALSQLTSKLDKYQTTFYASISTPPTDLESAFESESTRDEEMSMVQDQANQLDHILGKTKDCFGILDCFIDSSAECRTHHNLVVFK